MSRSNPTEANANPSRRWYEWSADKDGGIVRYYDKAESENVTVPLPFNFILLDELATVKGWHDASDSGIFSNEVRDTKQDVMVVRSFKGGELASGVYASIRDRVGAMGGHFVASCYIAFKDGDGLAIGNIGFKGAALHTWLEFKKSCKGEIVDGKHVRGYYVQAIAITGFEEGVKGKITYRTPKFALKPLSKESNLQAVALDMELQGYLSRYLARPKAEQVSQIPASEEQAADRVADSMPQDFDDVIPF